MTNIADKIINLLKASNDKRIKMYYYGDPLVLAVSNLPAVVVENRSSRISQTATGVDEADNTYSIKLIMNKKDEIGKNPEEMVLQRTMADILMGVDSNNQYKANTIVGILRNNFTLSNTVNDQDMSIEFALTERGDLITQEVEIIINIKDLVYVPSRT